MWETDLPLPSVLRRVLNPSVTIVTLMGILYVTKTPINGHYIVLAVIAFLLSSQVYEDVGLDRCWRRLDFLSHVRDLLVGWMIVVGVLLFLGYASKLSHAYSRRVLLTWFVLTPILLYASHLVTRYVLHRLSRRKGGRTAVVVGATDIGTTLARKLAADPYLRTKVDGFFDDRSSTVRRAAPDVEIKGDVSQVAEYVRRNRVNFVYVSLPMVAQPRIMKLLDELRDTTASVYFIPDIFVFDLLYARFGEIHGVPVVSVRDTPQHGINYFHKRFADVMLATVLLILLSPLMIAIAIGVKLSSRGPVIFRQRRYGLDGEEILVCKFRSMTVCEDGGSIVQARRGDQRVTRLGSFLRRTSLDELPQLFNVLAGSMSLVGPRPHAVAHNEQYRKLIKGYMVRHKVKPGITGWAQVNGLRGETDTLEKMQRRIEYDLQYIRNWSLSLDLMILVRTMSVVFSGKNAY